MALRRRRTSATAARPATIAAAMMPSSVPILEFPEARGHSGSGVWRVKSPLPLDVPAEASGATFDPGVYGGRWPPSASGGTATPRNADARAVELPAPALFVHALPKPRRPLVQTFYDIGRGPGGRGSRHSWSRLNTAQAAVFASASGLDSTNHQYKWNYVKQKQKARREHVHQAEGCKGLATGSLASSR